MSPFWRKSKEPCRKTRLFFALTSGLRQRAVDRAEGVPDLGTENTHNGDHNDGDERENNRILDKPLASFFGSKQHKILPFEKIGIAEDLPQFLKHDYPVSEKLHQVFFQKTSCISVP